MLAQSRYDLWGYQFFHRGTTEGFLLLATSIAWLVLVLGFLNVLGRGRWASHQVVRFLTSTLLHYSCRDTCFVAWSVFLRQLLVLLLSSVSPLCHASLIML